MCLILYFFVILATITSTSFSQDLRTYRSTITVTIQENDIAFAKSVAFQKARNRLLESAIRDLMGNDLYEEHYRQRYRQRALNPKDYLASYKVVGEILENEKFTMELEARIQAGVLADSLRKMGLILKNDPWYSVTALIEDRISVSDADLKKRLQLFHIDVPIIRPVDLTDFYWQEENSKYFVESLFNEYPQNRIIFLFESVTEGELEAVTGLQLKVFRKAGLEKISSLSMSVSPLLERGIEGFDRLMAHQFKKLMSRFTIQTLGLTQYDAGLETVFYLKVKGIHEPFLRYSFERHTLASNRSIVSYKLNRLANEFAEYLLESNTSLSFLYRSLLDENPNFYIYVENSTTDTLEIEAVSKISKNVGELANWQPNEQMLEEIKQTLINEKILADTEENSALSEEYFPELIELEPNNNSQNTNALPPSTVLIGRISNRADEDIYKLQCGQIVNGSQDIFYFSSESEDGDESSDYYFPQNSFLEETCDDVSSIHVEWMRVGKTTLSPQIRLYDQDFNFLIAYNLIGSQSRLRFSHSFEEKQPEAVFMRISDKIGYIPGETGGSKYFDYILKYYWKNSR